MATDTLTVREYREADYPVIMDWWNRHGTGIRAFSRALLPPVGIVVERDGDPQCALWAHLSVNCAVAFLDLPVTKPGLTLRESGRLFGVAIECIEAICRAHNYGLLVANANIGCARWLERNADFLKACDTVQMCKLL